MGSVLDWMQWPWPTWLGMTPARLLVAHENDWYDAPTAAWLPVDAAYVASQLHRGDRRRDVPATPYINHPLEAAHVLMAAGVSDPTELAAAMLHDTIEETGTTKEQLASRFGPAVACIVDEVSDDKSLSKARRKEMQILHAPHLSDGAKRVKLADKIVNVRDVIHNPPMGWSTARRVEYLDWAENVVNGLRGVQAGLEAEFDALACLRLHIGTG